MQVTELDFQIFGKANRVVDIDAEIADCAFQFAVPEQQLAGAQITSLFIDQRTLVRRMLCVP